MNEAEARLLRAEYEYHTKAAERLDKAYKDNEKLGRSQFQKIHEMKAAEAKEKLLKVGAII